jgi:hypothetical protein
MELDVGQIMEGEQERKDGEDDPTISKMRKGK